MEIYEIFAKIKAHMLEGMVFHDEMARYFDFLGLDAYRDLHREHYCEETEGYIKLCRYYMRHYNKLIPVTPMERPDVIPDSWYNYSQDAVDEGTKKSALKTAMRKWVTWEKDTKNLYEDMCGELLDIREIASAIHLMGYIEDVDKELADAIHMSLE